MSAPFVSYAQNGEDVVLWRTLKHRDDVFYVDVGAFHPTYDSVTRALYERGWRGVNIEAQPDRIAAFEEARPHDLNLNVAVSDFDGPGVLSIPDNPGWASLVPEGASAATATNIDVAVRTLPSLFREHGISHVDVLKVDVEGSEPAVVRGLLAGHLRPTVCVIEGVAPSVGRTSGDEAVALLLEAGYQHCLFDGLNHYLTNDPTLADSLALPANTLDGYVPDLVARLIAERESLQGTIAALAAENLALRGVADHRADASATAENRATLHASQSITRTADHAPEPRTAGDDELPGRVLRKGVEDPPRDAPSLEAPGEATPAPRTIPSGEHLERRRRAFVRILRSNRRTSPGRSTTDLPRTLLELAVNEHEPAVVIGILYRAVLGREPDPDGMAAWLGRLKDGTPALTLATEMASTREALARPTEHRLRLLRDLSTWRALDAAHALGTPSPLARYATEQTALRDATLVLAIFEVAYRRAPTAAELDHEVGKLQQGYGREWLLRSFANRPDVAQQILGRRTPGLRGRLRRLRDNRSLLPVFRDLVRDAEHRRIAMLLQPALTSLLDLETTVSAGETIRREP